MSAQKIYKQLFAKQHNLIEKLKKELDNNRNEYPSDLVTEIIEKKEETIPYLLEMLKTFIKERPRNWDVTEWIGGILAAFILAKCKEQQAFPLLIELCSLPYEVIDDLMGGLITENLSMLLASTFNGDLKALYDVITNQYLETHVRDAALRSHLILYRYNVLSREQFIDILHQLFKELTNDFSLVPTILVDITSTIKAVELLPYIEFYFEYWLVDLEYLDLDWVKTEFNKTDEQSRFDLETDSFVDCVHNIKKDLQWVFSKQD